MTDSGRGSVTAFGLLMLASLVAILATTVRSRLNDARERSRFSEIKAELSSAVTAERSLFSEFKKYSSSFQEIGYTANVSGENGTIQIFGPVCGESSQWLEHVQSQLTASVISSRGEEFLAALQSLQLRCSDLNKEFELITFRVSDEPIRFWSVNQTGTIRELKIFTK